jgi:hypothetical protein
MIILILDDLLFLVPSLRVRILEKLFSLVGSSIGRTKGKIQLMKNRTVFSQVWNGNIYFSLVLVCGLTQSGSDHTPLLIDSGNQAHLDNKVCFSFKLS